MAINREKERHPERQRRTMVARQYRTSQQGSHQNFHKHINNNWSARVKNVCNKLVEIGRRLTKPRPQSGKQHKKRPDLRDVLNQAELQNLQQQLSQLTELEWSNINRFGMSTPGGIRNVVQQLAFGVGVAINYSNVPGRELIAGNSEIDASLGLQEKAHERAFEAGGLSPEEINADEHEFGAASHTNPCKMELRPDYQA